MFTPKHRTVHKTRYEFRIESSAFATQHATVRDLTDTIHVALTKLADLRGERATEFDDAIHVFAADDEIVLYFDIDDDTTTHG